jgi:hypothetical protein
MFFLDALFTPTTEVKEKSVDSKAVTNRLILYTSGCLLLFFSSGWLLVLQDLRELVKSDTFHTGNYYFEDNYKHGSSMLETIAEMAIL